MQTHRNRVSRRTVLRTAALGGSGLLGAYLVGCAGGSDEPAATSTVTAPTSTQPPAPSGSTLRWQQLSPAGDAPPPRRDHSLVAGELTSGPRLYLFGGRNGGGELSDLWEYDIQAGEWNEIEANGPSPRHGHNAVWDVSSGKMLVFGGQSGSEFFNDLWQFDLGTNRWTELAPAGPVPAARYGAAAALRPSPNDPEGAILTPGDLLVTHGFTSAGRFDDSWQYDIEANTWTEVSPPDERPIERCLVRGAWDPLRNRLIIFGGQTTSEPFLGDLWTLSPPGWAELARLPAPAARNLYAMAYANERLQLILFGGKTADGPTNDLWLFDGHDEFWTEAEIIGERPAPRYSHDAAWVIENESLFVFGGSDGSNDLNDLWQLTDAS